MTDDSVIDALRRSRVLAILRRPDIAEVADDLLGVLRAHGVKAVECTLDQPGALDVVRRLRRDRRPDELVGGGTVMTTEQVDGLVQAGADFAVSPHLDEVVLAHAVEVGLPLLPGVMTPSEMVRAVDMGAPAVKLFPAGPLGLHFLRALQGPLGHVPIVATGGINVADVPSWLDAGAACVGLGSALTGPGGPPASLAEVLR